MKRIGIDFGGTKTEAVLVGEDPLQVLARERVATERDRGYEHIVRNIGALARSLADRAGGPVAVGLGLPGAYDWDRGVVRHSNTQQVVGRPLKADLESVIGLPLAVENDANCFALAEALLGAGRGRRMVLGVIMGTGMGGGVVADGRLWAGRLGNGGEWGHSTVDLNGAPCWCGRRGCLENYVSGTGLRRLHRERAGVDLTGEQILAARAGGGAAAADAEAAIDEFLRYFAEGMANLVNIFDPDAIVLGGGASNVPDLYTEGAARVARASLARGLTPPILKNELGDSAGVFGAALAATQAAPQGR